MKTITIELTLEQLMKIRTAMDTEYIRLEELGTISSYERRAVLDTAYPVIEDAIRELRK